METCYAIQLSYGEGDDFKSFLSFVTLDKKKAICYIKKYNELLDKLQVHYFTNRKKSNGFMAKLMRYVDLHEATIVEFDIRK